MKRILFTLALTVAAGCGSDGGSTVEPQAKAAAYSDLAVIGNSITYHIDYPSIDWHGSRGMASSAEANDFAHQTAAALALPVTAQNFVDLENNPSTTDAAIQAVAAPVKPSSLAVVELGDNAHTDALASFGARYDKLLTDVGIAKRLICVSTWWRDDNKDAVIKQACDAHGGRFVYIGDIRVDPLNQDRSGFQFADDAVNNHPHDWSMGQISKRIVAAAK